MNEGRLKTKIDEALAAVEEQNLHSCVNVDAGVEIFTVITLDHACKMAFRGSKLTRVGDNARALTIIGYYLCFYPTTSAA